MKRSISITAAAALAIPMLFMGVPAAVADDAASSSDYIVSTRSFPKVNTAKTDFFAEATSTDVEDDSNWGGLGSMDVPQTKSQAEKDAEKKAQEEEQARKDAEAAAAAEAAARLEREQAEAASRSQEREPIQQQTAAAPEVPASKNGASIAAYAQKFIGAPYVAGGTTPAGWDCSGFVQYVFAQFGINLPRTSGAQAGVGVAVPSLAQAQPGDILANGMHAAIYIGNGMVINALNPAQGTQITDTSVFYGGYSIRRVL
ncbi:NlpC/P60 family protein [Bifidobacterium pseudolongum]|uniref:NlpC/P60 family protein n=1 Tax=Bifidobacterium pseudolongum TaxID=1694 RepID=A0AB37NXD4_9BIFI|nr:NlpC/P60 family protein [Bifidobacterium pseudolongum]NBH69623.1 NlpC/P60 family protein [Bifidobacterium pseudolongum]RKI88445.1 NlpC/P60 family protein [Bifidobacterium pseudolongum]